MLLAVPRNWWLTWWP